MRTRSLIASVVTLSMGLTPLSALAASATTDVSEDDVMEVLESEAVEGMMMDRGGGGMYYPGPYGAGITVDASVTKEVTPDYVAVNGYCEVSGLDSRDDVRAELTSIYNEIKAEVGADGRVRRSGTPSVYPYYDVYGAGETTGKMSGSLNVFIRVVNVNAAERISAILDEHACSPGWDVRLTETEDFETAELDNLLTKVNKRKVVYEKLLGKKLTDVVGASLSTWVDGWSSYDPETNKADATTTLSITFDVGSKTKLADPAATRKEARMSR